ncbi:hypothetical protein AVEN_207833-1, partial [Araneus ventricosus]
MDQTTTYRSLGPIAENLGVEVGASASIIEIKKTIQAIPNYDEETLEATRLEEEKKQIATEREEKRIAAEREEKR